MPRYYLHLRDHVDELLDPEGVETSPDALPALALAAARDCMAGDIREGRLDLRYRIDVADENDQTVHSISFAEAVKIIPAVARE